MTHTWKIYDLLRVIADGVVTKVDYACESEDDGHSTRTVGTFTLSGSTDDEGFIAYADLTEENVLGWIAANVDKSAVEAANAVEIEEYKTRTAAITEESGLPW